MTENEKEWKKRERLQREILKYLKEHGQMHYDAVYGYLEVAPEIRTV